MPASFAKQEKPHTHGSLDTQGPLDTLDAQQFADALRSPAEGPIEDTRKLVLAQPDGCQTEIPLLRLPVTIGRSAEADIRVPDRWVSRRHCVLDRVDGQLTVRDLGSSNGTLVNRSHVAEAVLLCGDQLTVGMTTFLVSASPPLELHDDSFRAACG
jgi:pSer/pThr/pTyr-binding forkhead associated (FHA) protein